MNIENIVLTGKLSVLEYDSKKQGISLEEAIEKTKTLGVDGEKILSSHYRQVESFEKVLDGLGRLTLPVDKNVGDDIPKEVITPNSLVIACGGDNYFQLVSHFIKDQHIIGINTDPVGSNGALTYFTADSFIDFLPKLYSVTDNFNGEKWTRLQATINGKKIPTLATSEIYYGAYKSTDMSRYILELRKGSRGRRRKSEEQKSSGLIVSTKAGETGWYDAASRYANNRPEYSVFYTYIMQGRVQNIHPVENPNYPVRSAHFITREPFVSSPEQRLKNYSGYIREKETINLTWLAHGKGLVSIDARDEYEITRGDTVEIRISDTPLRVVIP